MNRLVDGERQEQYGDPIEHFEKVAKVWSVILGTEVTPEKAVEMMMGFKLVRLAHKYKKDSLDDLEGYATIRIRQEEHKNASLDTIDG